MPFSATRDLWLVLKARDEASRALAGFSRDVRMVGDSVRLANLQAARSALRNQLATQRLSGATQADMLVTQNRIGMIDQEIGQMRMAKSAMEEQRVSAQRLGGTLQGLAGTLAAVGTASTAIGIFGAIGLKNLVNSAIEYEKAASATRTQVDKFAISLRDIEDIGLRVAKNVGVSFQQIQPALFDIFSSMEVGAADAEMLLTTFAKAAVAGQTDIQSASRATIGILNAFQLPMTEVNHLMDLQFQLVQEGIGTYEEWTQRIGLVTPSAVRAGQSVETMLAALAATTRMGISAARSGTAVARAFDALSNPKAVDAMAALGVKAQDSEGKFRPLVDILGELRTALQKVPEGDRIAALLDIFKGAGGTIEARRFLQNMLLTPGNLEMFTKILEEMKNESGSFEQAYSIMAETTAVKTELMKNAWQTLKITAGKVLEPAFQRLIAMLTQVFTWFNKLTPQQQQMIVKLIALGVVLATVGGILLILTGTLVAFAAAAVMAGSGIFIALGALLALGVALAAFTASIVIAWKKSEGFRQAVKDTAQDIINFWQNSVVPAAEAVRAAFDEKLRPALERLWAVIQEKVMPVLAEIASHMRGKVAEAAKELVNDIKEGLINVFEFLKKIIDENLIPTINKLTEFYHEHKATIDTVIDAMIFLGKWILIIAGFITGVLVIAIVGSLVSAFVVLSTIIMTVISIIEVLISWFKKAKDWINGFVDDIKFALNPRTLENVGGELISGLMRGIGNKFNEVKQQIQNLGSSAIKWFKDAIGAGSPSKEFMKLGEYSVQGYMLGIQKALPSLQAQVTTATAGLTNAASNAGQVNRPTSTQTINITTQEIDPRRHAAELGYLLSGRM